MPRDARALFNRRVAFAAIGVGVVGLLVCIVSLIQLNHGHFHPHVWCESYSPGYEPKGCSAADDAAWAKLGIKPAPAAAPSKP